MSTESSSSPVELIDYKAFGALRLSALAKAACGDAVEVTVMETPDWHYMGRAWTGEWIGAFTDFLCLDSEPEITGAVSLELATLPDRLREAILVELRLPIARGMTREQVTRALGVAPIAVQKYVADRETLEFEIGATSPYIVSCTVHAERGLIFVTMIRTDITSDQ